MAAQKTSVGERPRRRLAKLVAGARGIEVRCPEHGHLLGVFIAQGDLEVKCRHDEFVVIRKEARASP
jgi:hypothetical protein